MSDLISRQAMLDGIDKLIKIHFDRTVVLYKARKVAEDLPPAQPEQRWIPITEESVIQAGYEGREVRFRIRGRLFAIRELAQ